MKNWIPLVGALFGLSTIATADLSKVEFLKTDAETVHFTPPAKPIKTGLADLKYIGKLKTQSGDPFFFFSGRSCSNDSCPLNLFAFPSSESEKFSQTTKPSNFVYPGSVTDPKKGVIYRSRAFLGRCISPRFSATADYQNQDVFIVFQDERVDKRNQVKSSVFITKPGLPYWAERLITSRPIPQIKDTLQLVKTKVCIEIPGLARRPILKPLNIKLPPALENDTLEQPEPPEPDDEERESLPAIAVSPTPHVN